MSMCSNSQSECILSIVIDVTKWVDPMSTIATVLFSDS